MFTDMQVVEGLQAGDVDTFRSLVERLEQPIIGYLHRLVGDHEVALDLTQDTFLQVYKEIGNMPGDLSLNAWIYRIATNYGLRYLNRKKLRSFIHLDTSEDYHTYFAVEGPEEQAETRILVEQALRSLKPEDAACLQLHYGDRFTYEEIAQIMRLSPEAVRKRVSRGVIKFRASYGTAPRKQLQKEAKR